VSDLRRRVREAVEAYVTKRFTSLGKPADALSSTDLFDDGVLDSVALTGLIAAVEHATGEQIDFIDVDPDALRTVDGIVDELIRAIGPR